MSSSELTLCADSYSVSAPPRIAAVASKRPRSFCQKYRWQATSIHAYILDVTKSEWADCVVRAVWEPIRENKVHSTRQGTHSHSRLSSLSHCELILTLKKWKWCTRADPHFKKKRRQEMNGQAFAPKSSYARNKTPLQRQQRLNYSMDGKD